MKKTIALYGLSLAALAFLLQWLDYQHLARAWPTELLLVAVATVFIALGIWVGQRLSRRAAPAEFEPNVRAMQTLGISEREREVLDLLADGNSNQEIADRLFVSTNTVKTHLKNLYAKLEVSRRTQAVHKARQLRVIP